jgi:hypothetical protein
VEEVEETGKEESILSSATRFSGQVVVVGPVAIGQGLLLSP